YVYTNDGNGNFTDDRARIPQTLVRVAYGVTLVDLDVDGDLDLMVATCPDSNVPSIAIQHNMLFVNDGDGFFQAASVSWPVARDCGIKLQAADLYGGPLPEVVVCNFGADNRILEPVSQ